MGCTLSKSGSGDSKKLPELDDLAAEVAGYVPTSGPLTAKDYKARLVSSEGTQTVTLPQSGYTVRYAYVSQRGYYPDSPDKPNQDAFCAFSYFGGDPEQLFFGVYDGHGENGTACSQFAKEKVPENLLNNTHFAVSPEMAYHQTMVLTNNQLHRADVDDSMSGTTAITVMLRGRSVYVANVGDSRAVLADRNGDRIIAQDLSYDQTPYRRDEAERVKRSGARVLTLDQLEGLKDPMVETWTTEDEDDGDPPRLWAPNGMYPGTAFTRSIGDSAAERIGVFAEPEVTSRQLSANNPFLVIASDGVFEFLPSQSVIDMVSKFEDPQEACLSVVAESYRLWLEHEVRTDDITMFVIHISGIEEQAPIKSQPTPVGAPWDYASRSTISARYTRSLMHRYAPIEPSSQQDDEEDRGVEASGVRTERTPYDLERLEEAVKNNFLFTRLTSEQRTMMFAAMEHRSVKSGELVVRQGERGGYFFVVDDGQFDVLVAEGDGPAELLHSCSAVPGEQNPSFGELALLYAKPRAASVMARTDGAVWQLHRKAFASILQTRNPDALVKLLRTVEVLLPLSMSQLEVLAGAFTQVTLEAGEVIMRQGEDGNEFFVLHSGEVVCSVRKNPADITERPKEVLRLGPGQYFGERALLSASRRAANVTTLGQVVLISISRETFEKTMGSLQGITEGLARWKEMLVAQAEAASRRSTLVGTLPPFEMDDLVARGVLYCSECSALLLMEHKAGENQFTVRVTSVEDAARLERQASVMRAREVTRQLQPCDFVPGVLRSFKDDRILAEVLLTNGLCSLESATAPGVWDDRSVAYIGACVALGLQHLHWSGMLYRSLSLETVLLNECGTVQLVDFRFARTNDGRCRTLCGYPEYLAPEVLDGSSYAEASDWWSLGVLLYHLLAGTSPFSQPGDDELRIYRRILARALVFPDTFSPQACDLISRLLHADPTQRLGCPPGGLQTLKQHPFFSEINWDALSRGKGQPPPGLRERVYNFEGVPYAHFDPKPCEGDTSWISNF